MPPYASEINTRASGLPVARRDRVAAVVSGDDTKESVDTGESPKLVKQEIDVAVVQRSPARLVLVHPESPILGCSCPHVQTPAQGESFPGRFGVLRRPRW